MSKENILVISDIHLGSPVCKTDALLKVLEKEDFYKLIINGDLLDNECFSRYKKKHWKVLDAIRKVSKKKEVILIAGNHDKNSEVLANILGIEFVHEYELTVNEKHMLFLHLDIFDTFIEKHPIITHLADMIYSFFQTYSKPISRWLKRNSKTFLDVREKIKLRALKHIENTQYDAIFGGHVHYAEEYFCTKMNKNYYNTGSFCDDPCHYLIIDKDGNVTLKEI